MNTPPSKTRTSLNLSEVIKSFGKNSGNALRESSVPENSQKSRSTPDAIGSETSMLRSPIKKHITVHSSLIKVKTAKNVPSMRQSNPEYIFTQVQTHQEKMVELIKMQYKLFEISDKLNYKHLNELNTLRNHLDSIVEPIEELNKIKYSFVTATEVYNFEQKLAILATVYSNLNAFLITEYLYILSQTTKSAENIIFTFITAKTLSFINQMGTIEQIERKIRFRSLMSLEGSVFHKAILSRLENNFIIDKLKVIFPPITYEFGNEINYKESQNLNPSSRILKSIENTPTAPEEKQTSLNESGSSKQVNSNLFSSSKYARYMYNRRWDVVDVRYSPISIPSAEITGEIGNENPSSSFIESNESDIGNKEDIHATESEEIKIINYYSNYKLNTEIFSELSAYELELVTKKNEIQTNSIMNLVDFSIIKIIILLNTLQYSMENFEIKYSVAAFECFKDCLEILHYILAFTDLVLKEFPAEKFINIKKYFLPTSKICQAHLYASLIFQSAEFIWSAKCRTEEEEKKVFYTEFLEFIHIFGTDEEIIKKLSYRNNNIYNKLTQEMSSIIPPTHVNVSNKNIITNIKSIQKSKKRNRTKQTKVRQNFSNQFSNALEHRTYSEYNYLHFDTNQIEKLLQLQHNIYNSYNDISNVNIDKDMKEFCRTLKIFEEFKEIELNFGTFIHSFLKTIDNCLKRHIWRIFVSHFYSFAFYMILIYYSKLNEMKNKTNFKLYRRNILEIITDFCPIYEIPEKLCFRNDGFFSRCTKGLFGCSGIVIPKSSKKLCKEISNMLKENESYYEKYHNEYISKPTSFNMQISKLEGKIFCNDQLFYIHLEGNKTDKSVHFKKFANDIMQVTLS